MSEPDSLTGAGSDVGEAAANEASDAFRHVYHLGDVMVVMPFLFSRRSQELTMIKTWG